MLNLNKNHIAASSSNSSSSLLSCSLPVSAWNAALPSESEGKPAAARNYNNSIAKESGGGGGGSSCGWRKREFPLSLRELDAMLKVDREIKAGGGGVRNKSLSSES